MPRQYTPRLALICAHCGTSFLRKRSHALRPSGATYCARECQVLAGKASAFKRAEQTVGEPLGEWLARRMAEGVPFETIVRECGLSDDRALKRIMAALGIPTRTRREATLIQWADNAARRAAFGQTIRAWKADNPEAAIAHSLIGNLTLQTTSPTSIERALMTVLDAAGIGYEFQYVVGDKFLCDFGFPESRLIVEADGSYWHRTERQKKRDASKDAYLRACGFTVLRLTEHDITQQLDDCLERIRGLLLT